MSQEIKIKSPELSTEAMTKCWKDSNERLFYVNEFILRTTIDAVKRQVELRCGLLLRRLETLQSSETVGQTALTAMTKAQIEHNLHSMERLIAEIGQINADVSRCFGETTALLFSKIPSDEETTSLSTNRK